MTLLLVMVLGIVAYSLGFFLGIWFGRKHAAVLQLEIDRMNDEADNKRMAERTPKKFRIRTAGSDPNRQTRVRTARLRAKKTTTPPPRN